MIQMTHNTANKIAYKPEVDGLRAIAVILVLLCHMKLGNMTGGYIGVDIFFVISGFLITSNLIDSIRNKRFSVCEFYKRRFVRLYPALFATVVVTIFAALLIADPATLKNLARTAKYALLSASNIFFYKHQGYFDVAADKQPFLHTWSLGVEWQFYLIWPILVWLLLKISRKLLFIVLLLICGISVYASQQILATDSSAAYYFMPYRAFELGLGSLLFFIYHKKPSAPVGILCTLAGLVAIIGAALILTPASPFPGYNALLPCFGALACIYGAQSFKRMNILRSSPFVYIGQISYSVYLVHWPLLVLYLYLTQGYQTISFSARLLLAVTTLILGGLNYALIEKRINWKQLAPTPKRSNIACTVIVILVAIMAWTCDAINKNSSGLLWRLGNSPYNNADYFTGGRIGYSDRPLLGEPETPLTAIVAGDSFAQSYAFGLDQYLKQEKQSVKSITRMGCLFSAHYVRQDLSTEEQEICQDVYKSTLQQVRTQQKPLILIASWDNYKRHTFISTQNGQQISFDTQESYDQFLQENLLEIKKQIGNQPLLIVGAVPYYQIDYNEKACLARPPLVSNSACRNQMVMQYPLQASATSHINTVLAQFAQTYSQIYFIPPPQMACPDNLCTAQQNAMIYDDGSHLSRYGAQLLTPSLWKSIAAIIKPEN